MENDDKDLIGKKSRGGLLRPEESLTDEMCKAYMEFLSVVNGGNSSDFVDNVIDTAEIDTDLCVLRDILKLFHKILSHHQCFKVIEKIKEKKRCSGKGRALRTKLADKNSL